MSSSAGRRRWNAGRQGTAREQLASNAFPLPDTEEGRQTVTEGATTGWTLTGIACTKTNMGTSPSATVDIQPGGRCHLHLHQSSPLPGHRADLLGAAPGPSSRARWTSTGQAGRMSRRTRSRRRRHSTATPSRSCRPISATWVGPVRGPAGCHPQPQGDPQVRPRRRAASRGGSSASSTACPRQERRAGWRPVVAAASAS